MKSQADGSAVGRRFAVRDSLFNINGFSLRPFKMTFLAGAFPMALGAATVGSSHSLGQVTGFPPSEE